MSIRPTYRKRSVVQVLADGMAAHPPTGRSCCEEARLTAAELARRNEELAEAEEEIAALKRMCKAWAESAHEAEAECDEWKAGAEAESWAHDKTLDEARKFHVERDEARDLAARNTAKWSEESAKVRELQAKLDDPYSEVNQKAAAWDRVEDHPLIGKLSELPEGDSYAERVSKRLDQLAEMESAITELQPAESHVVIGGKTPKWMRDEAERLIRLELGSVVSDVRGTAEKVLALAPAVENRPTLDREAVLAELNHRFGEYGSAVVGAADAIMALVPAAEGWPEWLGPEIDPDECDLDSRIIAPGYGVKDLRERAHDFARKAGEAEAAARRREAMEAEQAKRDDETSLADSATGKEAESLRKANTSGDSPDEDQRVEDVARKLAETMNPASDWPDDWAWEEVEAIRHAARAGWTPPESEAGA